MTQVDKKPALADRAAALREKTGDQVAVTEITSVVSALLSGGQDRPGSSQLTAELDGLLEMIHAARDELNSLQPRSVASRDIPDASSELGAVVETTESAATTVMDAADALSEVAGEVDDEKVKTRLEGLSTDLFEASSFQDITGQRIQKVTGTLAMLEERLASLAEAIGDTYVRPEESIEKDDEGVAVNDDDLLHGPQMAEEGNSQAEIDALLASFD